MILGACRHLLELDIDTEVLFYILDFVRVGTADVLMCQGSECSNKP